MEDDEPNRPLTDLQVDGIIVFIFLVLWGFVDAPWIVAAASSGVLILANASHSPERYMRLLFVGALVASPLLLQVAISLTQEHSSWVQLLAIFLASQPTILAAVIARTRIEKLQCANGGTTPGKMK